MRTVKFIDLITLSVERTKLILFQPFILKKWLKLLFIAILAGAVSGGGWGGGSGTSSKKAEAALENSQNETVNAQDVSDVISGPRVPERPMKIKEELHKIWSGFSDLPISLLAGAIVLVIVIVTGLIVLMLWLSARFKFVWLHAVVYNDAAISKPFREYRKEGDSIFKLSLVVGLSVLLVVGALGGWVYGSLVWADFFRLGTSSAAGAIISIIAAVIVFLAMIIFLCIWNVFVEHFVTPIMMLDRQTYLPSWAKFSSIYKNHRKDFWLYLLVFIGLGIVCSILEGIVAIGVIVLGVLAGGIVYGVGYLIFALLLKAKILFIGFAIGAGIPFVIAFVIVVLSIVLPCAVFFRAFALYFLSSLNEGYAPLALKE